jgi:hypothetical protein
MENLLSKKDINSLRKSYWKRLAIIWCWLVALAFPVFFVLAAPVYFAAGLKLTEIKDRNKVNEDSTTDQTNVFSLPGIIDKKSEAVMAYKNVKPSSILVRSVFDSAPTGIAVSEVIFERSKSKKADEIKISGLAKDREALSLYEQKLEELPFVVSAFVPVESFSRPTNLTFYINVTLSTSTNASP